MLHVVYLLSFSIFTIYSSVHSVQQFSLSFTQSLPYDGYFQPNQSWLPGGAEERSIYYFILYLFLEDLIQVDGLFGMKLEKTRQIKYCKFKLRNVDGSARHT